MEIAGPAAGVIPLIVLSFDKYRRVADLQDQYKKLDKHLDKCLKKLHTHQCLFKTAINALLRLCKLPDADRTEMMANLKSDRWSEAFLSSRLYDALGDDIPAVYDAIEGAKNTIEEIEAKLLETSSMITTNTEHRSAEPAEGRGGLLWWFTSRRLNRDEQFKLLLKDTTTQLNTLQIDLREFGADLQSVIYLRTLPTPLPLDNAIALPSGTVSYNEDGLKAVARQKASRKLHSIVSSALRLSCQCHLLHICLDDLETLMTEPVGSQLTEAPRFCFLLSSISDLTCPHGLPVTRTRIPFFMFTASNEEISAGSLSRDLECIYEKLRASDQPFEHLFCDPSSGGNGGTRFILRALALGGESRATQEAVISLDKLISSGITQLECLQIAKKLVKSVLSFYASPWISEWTLETVDCFDKTASDRREFFGTHIAVTFGDGQATNSDNCEIRALGRMLLHLGRKKKFQTPGRDDPKDPLKKELYELHQQMGKSFKNVVQNLITKWGSSNVDLMEEKNLKGFLSDIDVLEGLVEEFTPSHLEN